VPIGPALSKFFNDCFLLQARQRTRKGLQKKRKMMVSCGVT